MKQNRNTNRRIALASRASGAPMPGNCRLEQEPSRSRGIDKSCAALFNSPSIPTCVEVGAQSAGSRHRDIPICVVRLEITLAARKRPRHYLRRSPECRPSPWPPCRRCGPISVRRLADCGRSTPRSESMGFTGRTVSCSGRRLGASGRVPSPRSGKWTRKRPPGPGSVTPCAQL